MRKLNLPENYLENAICESIKTDIIHDRRVRGRGMNDYISQESKVEPNIRWKFYEEDTKCVALYSLPGNPQIFRKKTLLVDIRENGILRQIGRFFVMAYK